MRILVFGSLNIDITYTVDEIVKPGQNIISKKLEKFPGGKGLNQCTAIARAGSEVYLAGMIGEDGLFLKKLLENDGVSCDYIKVTEYPTGNAFIQVDNHGQNCIVAFGGANQMITKEYCSSVLADFCEGDYLVLMNEISEIQYIIDKAAERGMKIFFNPSPIDKKISEYDMSKVSFFIMNETEGNYLTGEVLPEKVLKSMLKRFPSSQVLLTLGADGAYYADKNKCFFSKAYPTNAVDTTGAGDTFTGYLISALSKGKDICEAMDTAAKASAIAVSRAGAAQAIPYMQELNEIFSSKQETR